LSDIRKQHDGPPVKPAIDLPPAVAWLAGIMVAVHLVRLLLPRPIDYVLVETLAFDSSVYTDPGVFAAKPAAAFLGPLTHVFVHADTLHIAVNGGMLLPFGAVVARRMGALWFVALFMLCGLAGALAWFVLYPTSPALLIGASGAISGMIGVATRLGMARRPSPAGRPPFHSRQQAAMVAGVWIALNLLLGLFHGQAPGLDGAVAWEAHLGGFAAGFLLTYIFEGRGLPRRPRPADPPAGDAATTPGTEDGDD